MVARSSHRNPSLTKTNGVYGWPYIPPWWIGLMPTFLELAEAQYPASYQGRKLTPLAGRSLVPVFQGKRIGARTLAWEHEGNRGIRVGDWTLVAVNKGAGELYDLAADRSETRNLAHKKPAKQRNSRHAGRNGLTVWALCRGRNSQGRITNPAKVTRRDRNTPCRNPQQGLTIRRQ